MGGYIYIGAPGMFPQKGVRVIGYPSLRSSVSVALTLLGLRGVVQCLLGLDPTLGLLIVAAS